MLPVKFYCRKHVEIVISCNAKPNFVDIVLLAGGGFSGYLNPTLRPAAMDVLTPDLRHRVECHLLQDEHLVLGKLMLEGTITLSDGLRLPGLPYRSGKALEFVYI